MSDSFRGDSPERFGPETNDFLRRLFPPAPEKTGKWQHTGSLCDALGGTIQLTANWFALFSDLPEKEKARLPLQSGSFTPTRIDWEPVAATISFEDYLALIDVEEDRRRVRETRAVFLYLPSGCLWNEEFSLLGRTISSRGQSAGTGRIIGWDGF